VGYDVHYQLFDKRLYECVHCAARAFLDRRDLAPLLAEMTAAARRVPTAQVLAHVMFRPFLFTRAALETIGASLRGHGNAGEQGEDKLDALVREQAIPMLVESCVVWRARVDPNQTMSAGPLPEFLCSQSRWLEDKIVAAVLESHEREDLEFAHGVAGQILSRTLLARLDRELAAIPGPYPPEVDDDLRAFRKLVAAAVKGQGLCLLCSLQ